MTIKELNYVGILIPTNKQPYKDLQCTLYYDSNRKRYWASIMPCAGAGGFLTECQPFNGQSETVLKVENRRSSKTDAAAIALFEASQPRYQIMFKTTEQKLAEVDNPPASPVLQTATA